jgi:ribulose kinase
VAAGPVASGFAGAAQAARALQPGTARTYFPDQGATATYEQVYRIFKNLHDTLGRSQAAWLHDLKQLRRQASAGRVDSINEAK